MRGTNVQKSRYQRCEHLESPGARSVWSEGGQQGGRGSIGGQQGGGCSGGCAITVSRGSTGGRIGVGNKGLPVYSVYERCTPPLYALTCAQHSVPLSALHCSPSSHRPLPQTPALATSSSASTEKVLPVLAPLISRAPTSSVLSTSTSCPELRPLPFPPTSCGSTSKSTTASSMDRRRCAGGAVLVTLLRRIRSLSTPSAAAPKSLKALAKATYSAELD
eukprot:393569-Prorocentrum_minimum.AAC.1